MDELTPVPRLRRTGPVVRILEAVVHRLTKRNDCRDHCHCVTELRAALGASKWIAGLALTAAFGSLASRGCEMATTRLPWNAPPARAGDVMPALDGKR